MSENQRSVARRYASEALYQMDVAGASIGLILSRYENLPNEDNEDSAPFDFGWFRIIVEGVHEHQREIDPLIESCLQKWRLSRLDGMMRAMLRAGVYELNHTKDVPSRVVLNEYIEIAKSFFGDDHSRFLNGVLDCVARRIDSEFGGD